MVPMQWNNWKIYLIILEIWGGVALVGRIWHQGEYGTHHWCSTLHSTTMVTCFTKRTTGMQKLEKCYRSQTHKFQ